MANARKEVIEMLNKALELEHAARIQYLAHAEMVKGINAEKLIERLKELASDEEKHEQMFRNLIGSYLNGEPTMGLAKTHRVEKTGEILTVNLGCEKDAVGFYKQIYKKVVENKESFPFEFETLEHEIRHIIIDEQEHITELSLLIGE